MESDNNSKSNKILQINMQEISKNSALVFESVKIIGELTSAFKEYGHDNYVMAKQELQKYLSKLKSKLIELNDNIEAKYFFLVKEKGLYEEKFIEAKAERLGFERKLYRKIIDELIQPYLMRFENELKSLKNIPKSQKDTNTSISSKPLIIENNLNVKNIQKNELEENIVLVQPNLNVKLPSEFKQITCHASKEQILKYFMILSKENNKSNLIPYMNEQDIKELVEKNFAVFNCPPTNKYFPINLNGKQKEILMDFIKQFYESYEPNIQIKEKYVYFLIHNFELFKNNKFSSLRSNLGKKRLAENSKKYIPLEKYYPNRKFQ